MDCNSTVAYLDILLARFNPYFVLECTVSVYKKAIVSAAPSKRPGGVSQRPPGTG